MEDDIKCRTAKRKAALIMEIIQGNTTVAVANRSFDLSPLVAKAPAERWATDLCRIWAGKDGWSHLALVIDCHTRELLGWHLSRSGRSKTAEAALEQA